MALKQRSVQSLEAGGQILLALARSSTPLALKDLAREARMTPARAHPYLVSFGKLELIQQDPVSGLYDLGSQALNVGLATLQRLDPLKIAREQIQRDGSMYSGIISIWGNLGPTTISFVETNYPVSVYLRPGTVVSLSTTATGQVFAAHMPRTVIRHALKQDGTRYGGTSKSVSLADLDLIAASVKAEGVARNVGVTTPGVVAVSSPVFDHEGSIALAITFIKPGTETDARIDSQIVSDVKACAAAVSRRLGLKSSI